MLRATWLLAACRHRRVPASLHVSCASQAAQLSSLVLAEHSGGNLASPTLSCIAAAAALGGPITALVAGSGPPAAAAAAAAARAPGVSHVLLADALALQHQLSEPLAALVASLSRALAFSHILTPASTFGKNVLPRAASLLGAQPVSDVVSIVDADTFVRPVYAGNALATVRVVQPPPAGDAPPPPRMLTVRPTAFQTTPAAAAAAASIEPVAPEHLAAAAAAGCSEWIGEDVRAAEGRPELGAAKVVVCGGRALKSKENFEMLERLADLLGGAVGASRAAVDAGFVANDLQVGQTGKVVAPQLYLAIGISGAIQHVAGMKDSKCIVAINTDAEAPIFQLADYGLVQDLFTALPELEKELAKVKGAAGAA